MGSPPTTEQAVSGTRLKARYWQSDDGARQFYTWFDTQRQEECSFAGTTSSPDRCLPGAYQFGTDFANFSNDTCASRAFRGAPDFTPSFQYAEEVNLVAARVVPSAIFRLGALQPVAPLYFRIMDGTCVLDTDQGSGPYYPLTEVPWTEFAAATLFTDP